MTNDKDSAVTQADKDAAARLNGYASWRTWEVLQQQRFWMMLCAQDFAKHRIASSQPTQSDALREENERLRGIVYHYVDPFDIRPEDKDFLEATIAAALQEQSK